MKRRFFPLQCLVIGCTLLQCSTALHANTCFKFHKRAPVKAICGRVMDLTGQRLNNAGLSLTGETGSVLYSTTSDGQGYFSFHSIPKGDYTLHVESPGYYVAEREIRVISASEKKCSPKIEVTLGVQICDTGTYVKGVDKKIRSGSGEAAIDRPSKKSGPNSPPSPYP